MACTITLSAGVPPSETSPSSNESSSPSSPREVIEPKVGEGDRGNSPPPVSACVICRLATSEQRYVMPGSTATTREVGVGRRSSGAKSGRGGGGRGGSCRCEVREGGSSEGGEGFAGRGREHCSAAAARSSARATS